MFQPQICSGVNSVKLQSVITRIHNTLIQSNNENGTDQEFYVSIFLIYLFLVLKIMLIVLLFSNHCLSFIPR